MRSFIPFCNECFDAFLKRSNILEVGRREPLALQDSEPLLNLIHPRTMNRREVHLEPWVFREPRLDNLAVMHPHVVADDVNGIDTFRGCSIDLLQEFDELQLAFSTPTDPDDFACAGVECGENVQRTAPAVFMFNADGHVSRARGSRLLRSRAWLDRCFFIDAEHAFVEAELARVKVHDVEHGRFESAVSLYLWTEPMMNPPWLERMGTENPLHGLRRNRLDDLIAHRRPRNFRAGPHRQAPVNRIGKFTGEFHEIRCDHRGKKSRTTTSRSIHEAPHSILSKPFLPFDDDATPNADDPRNGDSRFTICEQENDSCADDKAVLDNMRTGHTFEFCPLVDCQL